MNIPDSRWHVALRWAGMHALLSAAVAALSAGLVFGLWYPDPWRQMLGVGAVFAIVVGADVVCGPILTLVLASPKKSRRERWLDLSLVALIQVAALGYGLWAVYSARPVVLVFEADRYVVVTANELLANEVAAAPPELRQMPFFGVRQITVREPISQEENLRSIEASLQGLSPAMRPGWWRPFEEALPTLNRRARPLAELIARRPDAEHLLRDAALSSGVPLEGLRFLPLTSSKSLDWVALIDANGRFVGHAHVDAF
jgi:hypothetical protein